MSRFGIKSVSDGIELVLGPVTDESGHHYRVQLRSPVVTGSLEVYDHSASDLAAFFGELSALWWRGWDGEKTYESLEGQLRLVATRDALGHVYLDVEVRDGMGGPDFRVGARLVIDAGQLESVAEGVKGALASGRAAEQRVSGLLRQEESDLSS